MYAITGSILATMLLPLAASIPTNLTSLSTSLGFEMGAQNAWQQISRKWPAAKLLVIDVVSESDLGNVTFDTTPEMGSIMEAVLQEEGKPDAIVGTFDFYTLPKMPIVPQHRYLRRLFSQETIKAIPYLLPFGLEEKFPLAVALRLVTTVDQGPWNYVKLQKYKKDPIDRGGAPPQVYYSFNRFGKDALEIFLVGCSDGQVKALPPGTHPIPDPYSTIGPQMAEDGAEAKTSLNVGVNQGGSGKNGSVTDVS